MKPLFYFLLAIICCAGTTAQPAIEDKIDWPAYLSRHDPIWSWKVECTQGYTEHINTIGHIGAPDCKVSPCSSPETCLEESAAMCDICPSCAAFGLSSDWHQGLEPQLFGAADPSSLIPNPQWTTYTKNGTDLKNHSSCSSIDTAVAWEDAVFYGNGLLGGLVLMDGQDPLHTLRLQMGRTDIADHRDAGHPYATGSLMFDKPRLPVGSLGLTTKGYITNGQFRIHLANGTVTGFLVTTEGTISFLLLAHYSQLAIFLQWNATGKESPDPITGQGGAALDFVPLPGNSTRHPPPSSYKNNPVPVCTGSHWNGDVQVCTQSLLAGSNYATALSTRSRGAKLGSRSSISPSQRGNAASSFSEIDVIQGNRSEDPFFLKTECAESSVCLLTILHIANDNPNDTSPVTAKKTVLNIQEMAEDQGLFKLYEQHTGWWSQYWPISFMSIPDTITEGMVVLQHYKYASAARAGGPAIDLMGPWWQPSGWELYWWDMNVPVTYWATYAARRFDIAGTLTWWLSSHLGTMRKNIKVPSGGQNITDGSGFGSITSFDMIAPMLVQPGQQLGNPTWIAVNLLQHASFTANTTMMRELVYPFLRGTVNVYLAFCVNGSDGLIHLPPTASPEYPYPHGPANDTNYDLALFKWGAITLLRLASELRISDPLIPRWRDVVARLAPFPVNEHGYMVDSMNGFNVPHRHFSHLFAIYPLHLTNWNDADGGSPDSRKLISISLDRWTGLTCTGGHQKNLCPNGFTFDGAASISALIPGRALSVAGNVTGFIISGQMHASTLYSEGRDPCFESPPGAANAVQEMLIQSWGGRLRVFPAVPASWSEAVIYRMGAEGGLVVSAVRSKGKVAWVGVEAHDYNTSSRMRPKDWPNKDTVAPETRVVVLVAEGLAPAAVVATEPAGIVVEDAPGGAIAFNVSVGQLVILFPSNARPIRFVVSELAGSPSQFNYWGKHPKSQQ